MANPGCDTPGTPMLPAMPGLFHSGRRLQYTPFGGSNNNHLHMLAFSHRFTFGLCVSVIALTAVVIASVTLMFHKQQDNALLLQRIKMLKTENAALRHQVRQFTAVQTDTLHRDLTQPAAVAPAAASSELASDS
jgi:hypothetical protein